MKALINIVSITIETALNNKLGNCSLEQEGNDFFIVGADAVRKKLGSGNFRIHYKLQCTGPWTPIVSTGYFDFKDGKVSVNSIKTPEVLETNSQAPKDIYWASFTITKIEKL